MAGWIWTKPLARPALLLIAGAASAVFAQSPAAGPQLPTTPPAPQRSSNSARAIASAAIQLAVRVAQPALQSAPPPPRIAAAVRASAQDAPAPADTETAARMQQLPLTGRNWQNFALDAAPAATSAEADAQPSSRSRVAPAAVSVDGASIGLAFGGRGAGRIRGRGATLIGPGSSEVAIRQVETVADGADAVPDRIAGTRANVSSQRGANQLHGQGYLFNRQNLWGAQNPFTQWIRETAPATPTTVPAFTSQPYTPAYRETLASFGIGGRIRRNRLFWFASLDGYQRNHPGVSTVRHPENFFAQPSNDQMQVLSARLGLYSADPVSAGLAAYSGLLQTLSGLLGPASRTSTQFSGFVRADWQATERHRFLLEGTQTRWDAPGGGMTRAAELYGNHSYGSRHAREQWLLGRWEAFLTPNLMAVTQGAFARHRQTAPPQTPSAYEQTLNINAWGRLPQIVVDSRYGFTMGNPARFGPGSYPDEHLYQAQQQLDWVHGSLLLTAGLGVSHSRDAASLLRNQTGTYHYSSVENFASDALAFASFGIRGQLNPMDQHNCDQTGRVWRDTTGTLHGLGYLPCYSYYSQTMGPTDWWLATNDWDGYVSAQWQPARQLALSAAMRWEREQLPPPLSALRNPDLPLTQHLPALGNQWAPRISLAWGSRESRLPVLRLGYGIYYGRTQNDTLLAALTRTGSLRGDLYFFMRPTDNLNGGGAPPFPYVLAGEPASVIKPAAVQFAPRFRNPQVHQFAAILEQDLPGRILLDAGALFSLGRRLPVTFDANIDPAVNPKTITYAVVDGNRSGPLKTAQVTVPFFASWPSPTSPTGFSGRLNPNYQQVTQIVSRANSTYQAAMLRLTRYGRRGLSLRARYTYAHATDWNPNESTRFIGSSMLDPTNFRQEYGTSSLDVRHSASVAAIWEPRWKLHDPASHLANGWMISGIGYFHSGLPYSMRTAGSLAREFNQSGSAIVALATGINGSGGDNRVYGVGRNTYRYPAAWKADTRLARRFSLRGPRQLELLAESFNLFNHRNVNELETVGYTIQSGTSNGALPRLNFLTGLKTGQNEFGQPLNINGTSFYRQREIQFGLRLRF